MTISNNQKNIKGIYQLSPMQQGVVFHSLYEPSSGMYIEQISCKLRGLLNVEAFRRAWQEVIQLHDVLRTSFHWTRNTQPVQIVHRQVALPWIEQDWRAKSSQEQEADLATFLKEDRLRGFELRKAPLMRFHLFYLADNLYQFTWSNHHALFDGWSRAQLLEEVFALYAGLCQGQLPQIAPEHPYREYIAWLQKQDLAAAEAYWRAYLDGIEAPTSLKLEQGQEISAEKVALVSLDLPVELTAALRLYAQQQQVTLNTVVQGAWALLLHRYSGDEDILYGTTVSGRPPTLPGIENMVGLFINTLPVRVRIAPQQEVGSWLRELQEQLVEQRQYDYTPLTQIQSWSQVQPGQALFESLVVFENYPVNERVLGGLQGLSIEEATTVQQTNYPLTLVASVGSALTMQLSYAEGRFHDGSARRLLKHMHRLLCEIVSSAGRGVELLRMQEEEEWEMVQGWQGAEQSFAHQSGAHIVLQERASQWPDAIAVVAGEQHLSYAALQERADILARWLRKQGVGPEDRVGLCLARSLDLPVALLAVLKAGGAYVPLDSSYPAERLAFMLQDTQAKLLLTQQRIRGRLPQTTTPVYCLESVWEEEEEAQEQRSEAVDVDGSNLAYVIYTSGSTGVPKGALVEHRGLCNLMVQAQELFGVQPGERVLQFSSTSFDVSVLEIFTGWYAGASLWLLREEGLVLGRELGNLLREAGVTWMAFPPSVLSTLEVEALPELKTVVVGGEPCSLELMRRWRSGRRMFNSYGLTETSVWATLQEYRAEEEKGSVIGRAIGNVDVYILNRQMEPVPVGVTGEIYIGGACVGRGYLGKAEHTAERFVPHPWGRQGGERLYRTGDQGRYRENGEIEYLGREDGQVKIRGYRVELGEIETVLAGLEGVQACTVQVKEGNIVAYVVGEDGVESGVRVERWRRAMQEKVPSYLVPGAFVILEQLPLTPNGKVDLRALLTYEVRHLERDESYVAPQTPVQELIASIWQQVLGVERIGIEDDFFTLGGHSLLATQVYVRLRNVFNVDIPLRDLFEAPTIATLAERIELRLRAGETPALPEPLLRRRDDMDALPLSFAQQRLWFLDQWEPQSSLYNVATHVRLQGRLDVVALWRSLQQVIQRHEALRTTFPSHQGVPVQHIVPALHLELPVIDLADLQPEEREAIVTQLVTQEARMPFDLASGPLLRMKLLRLGAHEHELMLSMHHIVTDGWSMGVLVRELGAFYTAAVAGKSLELPALPIQYADYALWQRQLLQGEMLEQQISYWRKQLAGIPEALALPTDYQRPSELTFQGASQFFLFSRELSQKLQSMSQHEGVTLFMLLLASFQVLLARYSGQEDIVVGTPTANRSRHELEELIGFFVNTLVLRTNLSGDPTVRELLQRVREVCLGAFAHQDFPFEQLVEQLQPERVLSHTPLVQVFLVLQNTPLPEAALPGLTSDASSDPIERATAKFDLSVSFSESGEGLQGRIEFNTSLFTRATIERFVRHWENLLEGMVANVEQHVNQLAMLSEEERTRLLRFAQEQAAAYRREIGLHQLFEEQAQVRPDALALIYEEQQLSYGELNRKANQLAHWLRWQGVGPEVCVGLCVERGVEMVVGVLAILKAGGAYVPLDPGAPTKRLAALTLDCGVALVLTDRHGCSGLAEIAAPTFRLDEIWSVLAGLPTEPVVSPVNAENVAYVLYTSGSTGLPKGVMVAHRAVVNYVYAVCERAGLRAGASSALLQPLTVDSSVTLLFGSLCMGGRLHLIGREQSLDAGALDIALQERPADYLKIAPSHLAALLQGSSSALLPRQALIIGGEASQRAWACDLLRRQPEMRAFNHYGPTETTVGITMYPITEQTALHANAVLPLGRPLANTRIFVVQAGGDLAPVGVAGEICVGGENLARGYLGRAELTAERFVPDPFSQQPGARLYRTGDLGRWLSDGTLEFLGRADAQVKIRGYRIELGEIEAVLAEHEAVQACAVLAREETSGQKRLVAYVVAHPAAQLSWDELRAFAHERLPDYMQPGAWVCLPALPQTSHGKLDRRALPAPEQELREETMIEAHNEIQAQLVAIWQQVLGIERVGIRDNFFALGGDSILSIQIVARAGQQGLHLTPKQLFQAQNIEELSRLLEQRPETQRQAGPQGMVSGAVPLTPIQHRFFAQRRQVRHHYNQARLLQAQGEVQAARLAEVLDGLQQQHDALRLCFASEETGWQQWYADPRSVVLQEVDLSALPVHLRRQALEQAAEQVQASLDLEQGPLWRAVLFHLGEPEGARLLLVLHHLIVDGVSWRVLLEDLAHGYEQRVSGKKLAWPEKSSSYQQWSQAVQDYGQRTEVRAQAAYWRAVSQTPVARLPLRVSEGEQARRANTLASARGVQCQLGEQETRALLQEVPGVYHTRIQEVLLTALLRSLSRCGGGSRWRIALEGHGREEEEVGAGLDLSRTVGWFTSLYPVLLEEREGVGIGAVLKAVKEQVRAIPAAGISYGVLRYLCPELELTGGEEAEEAEISFNYLGQVDGTLTEMARQWRIAPESAGAAQGGEGERPYVLEVNAIVVQGALQVNWRYSEQLQSEEQVRELAETFVEQLREIIAHCRQPGVGGSTPSDFPLARVTQRQIEELEQRQATLADLYPLSPMQQGMLFHTLYEPGVGLYIGQISCQIDGPLDSALFRRAWQAVIDRYAILRTAFVWENLDAPLQVVRRSVPVPWDERDWRGLDNAEQQEAFDAFLREERARGFELDQAPLMHLTLFRLAEHVYRFTWSNHHLISDGWSRAQLLKEVFDYYEAERQGKQIALAPARPYRDYIAWLQEQDMAEAERFWRQALQDVTSSTPLAVEQLTNKGTHETGEVISEYLALTEETTAILQTFAREQQITVNTLVQGAWALLLSRYSGEANVLYGMTVAGRPAIFPDAGAMVGMFINTLPVRLAVPEQLSVRGWLQQIQQHLLELRQYEYTPLSQIQGWSQVPRGMPLFESIVVFENYPVDDTVEEGLSEIQFELIQAAQQTNYPLTLVAGLGRNLRLRLTYTRDRFGAPTIKRLLEHFRILLESMAANAELHLSQITPVTLSEREYLLQLAQEETTHARQNVCLPALFEEQAQARPDALALLYEKQQLSYGELNRRANQLAHWLRRRGVGPEVCVGLCVERGLEMVIGVLAILKAGGAYVPLDPTYPRERLAFMLQDSQVPVLLSQQHLLAHLPVTLARSFCLDTDWHDLSDEDTDNLCVSLSAQNIAYVIYTSGSSGQPKGVMIRHCSVINLLAGLDETIYAPMNNAPLRVGLNGSLAFDTSVKQLIQLVHGHSLHILPQEVRLDADALAAYLRMYDVEVLDCTPLQLRHLLLDNLLAAPEYGPRSILIGGDAIDDDLWNALAGDSHHFYYNLYGPTECTVDTTVCRVGSSVERPTIGRPLPHVKVYVLDAPGQLAPLGVVGEICVGGENLARGYLGRAELTAERFVPDPFSRQPGARLYRTGDLGRWLSDGTLEFLGRADAQVKIRGYRIELGEIEAVLTEHEAVQACAVLAREETSGQKRLVAYVVAHPTAQLSWDELRAFAHERLPDYMLPGAWVCLPALPQTSHGKLDRRALPAPEQELREETMVEATNEVQAQLIAIWQQVLGIERVGIRDNFFALGGDSILSIQIVARASQQGLRLSPKDLFHAQTIEELSLRLQQRSGARAQAPQGMVSGAVPLTPIQRRFFSQERARPQYYNQSMLLRAQGAVQAARLAEVLDGLQQQHDALRLCFASEETGWRQWYADPRSVVLQEVDLSALPVHLRRQGLEQAAEQAQASLDLEQGPLWRAVLFHLGEPEGARLLLVLHHLIVDGVSWRVLLEDLTSGYELRTRGKELAWPAKSSSYQQWSQAVQDYGQRAEVRAQAAYWREVSQTPVARLPLRVSEGEQARQANTLASIRWMQSQLGEQETRALLQEVPGVYHTRIQEVLLTALLRSLSRWGAGSRWRIALEGHGREEEEVGAGLDLSRTVGWFTSLYPVLLEEREGDWLGAVLKAVKEQVRAIPTAGISYGVLRWLCPEVELAGGDEEICFNYLGQVDGTLQATASQWVVAQESAGPAQGQEGTRPYVLEVSAIVSGGELQVNWRYSERLQTEEQVRELAETFVEQLREIIAHCRQPGVGSYTPSDFPLVQVEQRWLEQQGERLREVEDLYPLSPMQQGMLFHTLYEPTSHIYSEEISCRIDGSLDRAAFRRAWQAVIDRHPILRTAFLWEGVEEPLQLVRPALTCPWNEHDWREFTPEEQRQLFESFLSEERTRGFALDKAPLMRLTLFRLSEHSCYFVWTHHHLLLDGWSLGYLLKEVFDYYEAELQGKQLTLPTPRPYRDYIAWLQRQNIEEAEIFWRRALQDQTSPTALRMARAVDGEKSETAEAIASEYLTLTEEATARLQTFAREQQITVNTLVQGAWALLLSRYSGESAVVYGTTVAGRPPELEGVEEIVGVFINTLPVRLVVQGQLPVSEWLQQVQQHLLELQQYEYCALSQIQGWSQVPRGTPLFESLVVFENYPVDRAVREGLRELEVEQMQVEQQSNYPLTLVASLSERLRLRLSYTPDRFGAQAIARLLGHLQTLLETLATDSKQPLSAVTLLSAAERQRILVEWNATATPYPARECIHQLFEAGIESWADAIAVASDEQQLTYAELNHRANQLAHYLQARGVGPETCVGLCVEHSLDLIAGMLGILKAGGVYVTLDPTYPAERLAFMLQDAHIGVLLAQSHLCDRLPDLPALEVIRLDQDEAIERQSISNCISTVQAENTAYVVYTSGSTGIPKGIRIPHKAVNRLVMQTNYVSLEATDHIGQASNTSFDALTFEVWGALLHGARIAVIAKEQALLAQQLEQQLQQQSVTTLFLTTALFNQIVRDAPQAFASLKHLLFGGEAVDPRVVKHLLEGAGPQRLLHVYGPTECTTFATWYEVKSVSEQAETVPIGGALANTQIYVLDQNMGLLPAGIPGELYIGGAGLAVGYLERPALTAERFVPHPYASEGGARLYKTGDLVRWTEDGMLEFIGRVDNQVKIRGHRIEPDEVEIVLRQHRAVREVLVMVREDLPGDRRLVAYVAPQPEWSSSLSGRELRSYLRERLPDYMVPAVFMVMETLPLTPNGKIDKAALPVPDPGRMSSDASTLVSRTPVQELLVGIWQQVLGLETVGIDDDFFALGGHSLLATQVHSRLRATFALDLPLRVLFEASTIADLATRVEMYQRAGQGLSSEEPPLVPRSLPGPVPLSFAQQRLWFLDQWEPESPLYNVASAVRLVGRLDVQALRESLQRVVMRHESLRTTFASSQGQPMQIIAPALEIALPVIDLSALPSDERDALAAQLATEEAQQPFSLAHGPLLRVQLVRLHKGEHALILSMHHIVADGWSLGVLVRELGAFYTAEVTGAQIELPALPLQYADYALWQRQWLQGEVLERQLAYWRNRLSGAPELLNLPIDYARPEVQSYRGASQSLTLPPALLIKLRQLSQREGMTLFMTLLAIFQVLLAFASGQEDVVVGTPIANRTRPELEGLIGFFVNTLVLRTNLEGDPTIQELLQRVRETCLGAYAHQDLPFEQLVQLLHIKRTTSHMPLFQIWFVLMEDNAGTSITLPGLTFEPQTGERNLARYDLRLNLYTGNDGLRAVLEYQTDLFARTTIERMLRHFALLLQQFADAPAEQKLSLIIRTLRDADQRLLQERQETVSVLKMQKLKRVRRESVRGVAE